MMSKEIVKYSLKNLYKRKTRSLLTIISILVGIATIFIFVSFSLGLYSYIDSFISGGSADKIIIQPKGSSTGLGSSIGLTEKDLTAIKGTSGVYDATGYYLKIAQITNRDISKYSFVAGHDPKKAYLLDEASNLKIGKGRNLQSGDNNKVVLGYNYQLDNTIFAKGLSLNDVIEIQGQKVKIIGFYQEVGNAQDDANIYITDDLFRKIYDDVTDYSVIIAKVDSANLTKVSDNIDKSLLNSRNLKSGQEDFSVQSFEQILSSYSSALNIVIGFVILIALISVLVSAINTSNTMITSVLERMKEIGVLKSIGARNSEVLGLFLFESGILGFVAGVLGVLLGFGLSEIAGYILKIVGFGFLQPAYSFWLFAGCVLFATATGAISGMVPAIKASRINPVEALRYE